MTEEYVMGWSVGSGGFAVVWCIGRIGWMEDQTPDQTSMSR